MKDNDAFLKYLPNAKNRNNVIMNVNREIPQFWMILMRF